MIEVADAARAVRILEAWHMLSLVLPLYDEELRSVFRAGFNEDLVDLMPKFFQQCAKVSIENFEKFDEWFLYISELHDYTTGETDKLPVPLNTDQEFLNQCRKSAEKMVNAWMVREEKEIKPYIEEKPI